MSQQHQPRIVPQPAIALMGLPVRGGRYVPYPLLIPEGEDTVLDLPTIEIDAAVIAAWYQFSDGRN